MDVSRDLRYCESRKRKRKRNTSTSTVVCLLLAVLCFCYIQRALQMERPIHCISVVSLQQILKGYVTITVLLMSCLDLVCGLPYFKEADSGVEPVENGQRHGNMGNDGPGPNTEKLEVLRAVLSMSLLHGVYHPHGSVSYEEERD